MNQLRKLALVVPSLIEGGGVAAVAEFIKEVAVSSNLWDLTIVSLSTTSTDPLSFSFIDPRTWLKKNYTQVGIWQGMVYTHVGSFCREIEFQRYRHRRALRKLISEVDVVQVVCGSPAWANSVIDYGKPISLQVATLAIVERKTRDSQASNLFDYWRRLMSSITNYLDDRALKKVDAVQVENNWMLEYSKKINMNRKVDIRYAPPGIDIDIFKPGISRNLISGYILSVARFSDPRKNINLLLSAYAKLSLELRSNFRLVLAGSSSPPTDFWELADRLGVSSFITYVARPNKSELVDIYQKASVFALTSNEEGLGIAILEAMACGIPVVSTQSGGPDGIITNDVDGYLSPIADCQSIAMNLAEILKNPDKNSRMGFSARKTIKTRYAKGVTGAEFLSVWDSLAPIVANSQKN